MSQLVPSLTYCEAKSGKVSFVIGFEYCTYFRFRAFRKFHLGVTRQLLYLSSVWIQANILNCHVVAINYHLLVPMIVWIKSSIQICNVIAVSTFCFVLSIVWIENNVQTCKVVAVSSFCFVQVLVCIFQCSVTSNP
jgi:hypothetical protein